MSNRKSLLIIMAVLSVTALPALAAENSGVTGFATLSDHYLAVQTALANDSLEGVHDNALAIAAAAKEMSAKFDVKTAGVAEKDGATCAKLLPEIAGSATNLAAAKDFQTARAAFAELSESLVVYRDMVPGDDLPEVAYCPMADHKWLQAGKTVSNPYFGSKMLRCGKIVSK